MTPDEIQRLSWSISRWKMQRVSAQYSEAMQGMAASLSAIATLMKELFEAGRHEVPPPHTQTPRVSAASLRHTAPKTRTPPPLMKERRRVMRRR